MPLNAFVGSLLAFDRATISGGCEYIWREIEHLFLGLALDLPGCEEARKRALAALDEAGQREYAQCGPNIPVEFAELLTRRLEESGRCWTVRCPSDLDEFRKFLSTIIVEFLWGDDGDRPGTDPGRPFCADARSGSVNRSRVPDGYSYWRYISAETFNAFFLRSRGPCRRPQAARDHH